jgi:hypothetical protein
VKYYEPAARLLEALGFREERFEPHEQTMRLDLRGYLAAASLPALQRWFAGGAYREDASECLHRELAEELTEVGFAELGATVRRLTFAHVRTFTEGPRAVPGKPYRQYRQIEVHDLVVNDKLSMRLHRELVGIATDPAVTSVISARSQDIAHGRCGTAVIAPQSALLVGPTKPLADVPPLR